MATALGERKRSRRALGDGPRATRGGAHKESVSVVSHFVSSGKAKTAFDLMVPGFSKGPAPDDVDGVWERRARPIKEELLNRNLPLSTPGQTGWHRFHTLKVRLSEAKRREGRAARRKKLGTSKLRAENFREFRVSRLRRQAEAAVLERRWEDLLLAIEAGAPPNLVTRWGETSLAHACVAGELETVATMLKLGSDVNLRSPRTGETPLLLAVRAENRRLCALLLELGADVEAICVLDRESKEDGTVLMVAASMGSRGVSLLVDLLAAGADPGQSNSRGRTALHFAARFASWETVRVLVAEPRLNPAAVDAEGYSATDYVRAVAADRLLREKEARVKQAFEDRLAALGRGDLEKAREAEARGAVAEDEEAEVDAEIREGRTFGSVVELSAAERRCVECIDFEIRKRVGDESVADEARKADDEWRRRSEGRSRMKESAWKSDQKGALVVADPKTDGGSRHGESGVLVERGAVRVGEERVYVPSAVLDVIPPLSSFSPDAEGTWVAAERRDALERHQRMRRLGQSGDNNAGGGDDGDDDADGIMDPVKRRQRHRLKQLADRWGREERASSKGMRVSKALELPPADQALAMGFGRPETAAAAAGAVSAAGRTASAGSDSKRAADLTSLLSRPASRRIARDAGVTAASRAEILQATREQSTSTHDRFASSADSTHSVLPPLPAVNRAGDGTVDDLDADLCSHCHIRPPRYKSVNTSKRYCRQCALWVHSQPKFRHHRLRPLLPAAINEGILVRQAAIAHLHSVVRREGTHLPGSIAAARRILSQLRHGVDLVGDLKDRKNAKPHAEAEREKQERLHRGRSSKGLLRDVDESSQPQNENQQNHNSTINSSTIPEGDSSSSGSDSETDEEERRKAHTAWLEEKQLEFLLREGRVDPDSFAVQHLAARVRARNRDIPDESEATEDQDDAGAETKEPSSSSSSADPTKSKKKHKKHKKKHKHSDDHRSKLHGPGDGLQLVPAIGSAGEEGKLRYVRPGSREWMLRLRGLRRKDEPRPTRPHTGPASSPSSGGLEDKDTEEDDKTSGEGRKDSKAAKPGKKKRSEISLISSVKKAPSSAEIVLPEVVTKPDGPFTGDWVSMEEEKAALEEDARRAKLAEREKREADRALARRAAMRAKLRTVALVEGRGPSFARRLLPATGGESDTAAEAAHRQRLQLAMAVGVDVAAEDARLAALAREEAEQRRAQRDLRSEAVAAAAVAAAATSVTAVVAAKGVAGARATLATGIGGALESQIVSRKKKTLQVNSGGSGSGVAEIESPSNKLSESEKAARAGVRAMVEVGDGTGANAGVLFSSDAGAMVAEKVISGAPPLPDGARGAAQAARERSSKARALRDAAMKQAVEELVALEAETLSKMEAAKSRAAADSFAASNSKDDENASSSKMTYRKYGSTGRGGLGLALLRDLRTDEEAREEALKTRKLRRERARAAALKRSRERIQSLYREAPELELARFYLSHDRAAEAEKVVRETLAAQREKLGREDRGLVRTLVLLADVHLDRGRATDAQRVADEALTVLQAQGAHPGAPDHADALAVRGRAMRAEGHGADEVALLRRALDAAAEVEQVRAGRRSAARGTAATERTAEDDPVVEVMGGVFVSENLDRDSLASGVGQLRKALERAREAEERLGMAQEDDRLADVVRKARARGRRRSQVAMLETMKRLDLDNITDPAVRNAAIAAATREAEDAAARATIAGSGKRDAEEEDLEKWAAEQGLDDESGPGGPNRTYQVRLLPSGAELETILAEERYRKLLRAFCRTEGAESSVDFLHDASHYRTAALSRGDPSHGARAQKMYKRYLQSAAALSVVPMFLRNRARDAVEAGADASTFDEIASFVRKSLLRGTFRRFWFAPRGKRYQMERILSLGLSSWSVEDIRNLAEDDRLDKIRYLQAAVRGHQARQRIRRLLGIVRTAGEERAREEQSKKEKEEEKQKRKQRIRGRRRSSVAAALGLEEQRGALAAIANWDERNDKDAKQPRSLKAERADTAWQGSASRARETVAGFVGSLGKRDPAAAAKARDDASVDSQGPTPRESTKHPTKDEDATDNDDEKDATNIGSSLESGSEVVPVHEDDLDDGTKVPWVRYDDPNTGYPYYTNTDTGETVWELPEDIDPNTVPYAEDSGAYDDQVYDGQAYAQTDPYNQQAYYPDATYTDEQGNPIEGYDPATASYDPAAASYDQAAYDPSSYDPATQATYDNYYYDPSQEAAAPPGPQPDELGGFWIRVDDESSGRPYFYHSVTNETKWELDEGVEPIPLESLAPPPAEEPAQDQPYTDENGYTYDALGYWDPDGNYFYYETNDGN